MHKTAMARKRVSKPMEWIMKNVDIAGNILHFGEGRAWLDTDALSAYGDVAAYEPYPDDKYPGYAAKTILPDKHFDYIIAIYVLNVLEPTERMKVLKWLREHGDVVLVAVRTDKINGKRYKDGVKTSTGTFQKSFGDYDLNKLGKVLTKTPSFAIVEL